MDGSGYVSGQVFRERARANNAALIHDMLKAGMPVDTPQEDGCTALWLAAEAGAAKTVAVLLQFNANPQAPKILGHITPMYIAAQNGHAEVVDLLLGAGADPNVPKDTGATPLFIASQQNFPQIVRSLLLSGATVSAVTKQGISPLMIASFQGNVQVIKQLLAAGADPYERGNGLNAFEWAAENGYRDRVQSIFDASPAGVNYDVGAGAARSNSTSMLSMAMNQQQSLTPSTHHQTHTSLAQDEASSFRFGGYQPQYLASAIDPTTGYDRAVRVPRGGLATTNYSTLVSTSVGNPLVMDGTAPRPTERLSRDVGNMQRRDFNATRMNTDRIRDEETYHTSFRSRATGDNAAYRKRSTNGLASTLPAQRIPVDHQWESFKQRFTKDATTGGTRELDDAWLYSHSAVRTYGANIETLRRQRDGQQLMSSKPGADAAGEGVGQVALPQPKIQRLSAFLDAGKGAKGPSEVEISVAPLGSVGGSAAPAAASRPKDKTDNNSGSDNDWY